MFETYGHRRSECLAPVYLTASFLPRGLMLLYAILWLAPGLSPPVILAPRTLASAHVSSSIMPCFTTAL